MNRLIRRFIIRAATVLGTVLLLGAIVGLVVLVYYVTEGPGRSR